MSCFPPCFDGANALIGHTLGVWVVHLAVFLGDLLAGFYASFPLYEQGAVDQLDQVVIDIHALRHSIDQVFDILFVHLLASCLQV
jgi:hypothetical protein